MTQGLRKNLILIAAAIFLLAAVSAIVFHFRNATSPFSAVPEDAISVWITTPQTKNTSQQLAFIANDQQLLQGFPLAVDQPIVAALQFGTPNQMNVLFVTKVTSQQIEDCRALGTYLSTWQGIKLYRYQHTVFALHKGLLMLAPHAMQVESAIQQLEEGTAFSEPADKKSLAIQMRNFLNASQSISTIDFAALERFVGDWSETITITSTNNNSEKQFSSHSSDAPFLLSNAQEATAFLQNIPINTSAFIWGKRSEQMNAFVAKVFNNQLKNSDLAQKCLLAYNEANEPLYVFELHKKGKAKLDQLGAAESQLMMYDLRTLDGQHYFSYNDQYLWVTTEKAVLESTLNQFLTQQFLTQDETFLKSYAQLPSQHRALVYARHSVLQSFFANQLNWRAEQSLAQINNYFERPQQFFLSFGTNEMDVYALPIKQARYRPPSTLEPYPLEATIAASPTLFQWQETDYLLAEDVAHRLYLMEQNGQLKWVKELDGQLLAAPQLMTDGRLFFQTNYRIYVCNLSGEYASGFPFSLQTATTTPACLIDFSRTGNYHYLVASEQGQVYGYDMLGKPLEGWSPKDSLGGKVRNVQHFQRDSKDYILTVVDSSLQVFDRLGNLRFAFKEPLLLNAKVEVQASSDYPRIVAAEPSGNLWIINFEGAHFKLPFCTHRDFLFEDIWGDERKDYIAVRENEIRVYAYEGTDFELRQTIPVENEVTVFVRNGRLATMQQATNELMWYTKKGERDPNFPLVGNVPFTFKDQIIYTGNDREVIRYQVFE